MCRSIPINKTCSRCTRINVMRFIVAFAGAMLLAQPVLAETFTNPIIGDGADPWVTQWKGQYFYARSAGGQLYVDRATKLQDIGRSASQSVWRPPTGTAYSQNLWAPELHYLDNKWYMYVAADDGDNANHRMHVLEGDSQDPQGTYTYKGKIAAPTDRYAIDGTVFENGGSRYFIWSGWEGTDNGRQDLYIAPMSNPWTIGGERVLISKPDYTWEKHGLAINEGPTVLRKDGTVNIIYSASGFWRDEYALGQLTLNGRNVLSESSWIKKNTPVFSQTSNVNGPGHASFVKSPDRAEDWIVYHAHDDLEFDGGRDVRIQPFGFNADNTPNFGSPVNSGVALQEPSGRAVVTFIPNGSFDRMDVTSAGGPGIISSVESFRSQGEVGLVDNTGRFFAPIAGGDGRQVGFIGAAQPSALTQDIGLIVQPGTFELSAGFAISSDQAGDALSDPTTFKLLLESVGLNGRGFADEGDVVVLGEIEFSSSSFNAASFTYFSTTGIIPLDSSRLDTLLRIGIYSIGNGSADWEAKVDNLSLVYSTAVPEPAALGTLYVAMGLLLARRRRGTMRSA